jgi:hypothetical protein
MVSTDEQNPYWIDATVGSVAQERVAVRYVKAPRLPLWLENDDQGALGALSVSRGQGTVFNVTAGQWKAVMQVAGGWPSESSETDYLITQVRGSSSGVSANRQGRLTDPEVRGVIDRYAMERAIAHFTADWKEVHDVSRFASFDLLCRRDADELRVEVKGTTTLGEAVLITRNELENARKHFPCVALFVTSEIVIDRSEMLPRATGGKDRILCPWDVSACRLTPVQLECWLPGGREGHEFPGTV